MTKILILCLILVSLFAASLLTSCSEPAYVPDDADETGLVLLPNVNLMEEMVSLLAASRVFEANVAAFNAAKTMALKSLEIGNR